MPRGVYERTLEHRARMSAVFMDREYTDSHKRAISDAKKLAFLERRIKKNENTTCN